MLVKSELSDVELLMVSHVSDSVQALVGGAAQKLESDCNKINRDIADRYKRDTLATGQLIVKLNDAWEEKFVGTINTIQQQVNNVATLMTNFLKQQDISKDLLIAAVQ